MNDVAAMTRTFFTLPLGGRVETRRVSGWGSFSNENRYRHPRPLPTTGRGEMRGAA